MGLDLPPVPLAATLIFATGAWTCTFDQPIQPGSLAVGNWTLRATDSLFVPTTAVAAGSVVSGASNEDLPDAGDDVVNYAAAPADVLSLTGLAAAAFTDFPLVVS